MSDFVRGRMTTLSLESCVELEQKVFVRARAVSTDQTVHTNFNGRPTFLLFLSAIERNFLPCHVTFQSPWGDNYVRARRT